MKFGHDNDDQRQSLFVKEHEFDVRNVSYPIHHQLELFDTIVERTREMCHRLRDPEDSFRFHFEQNTPAPPPNP